MVRILVVDDDASTRELMAAALARPEREVATASDGDEALSLARTFLPHLVVTDVAMPRRSGFELAQALAERRETALASIIFVSGLGEPEHRIFGLRLGAVDYLTKPFAVEELTLRADQALRNAVRAHELFAEELSGSLSQLALPALLNVLAMESKSGELALSTETTEARLLFRDGHVVAASMTGREATGAALVYELLDWHAGHFAFHERTVAEPDELGMSTTALLLEAARRSDERSLGAAAKSLDQKTSREAR